MPTRVPPIQEFPKDDRIWRIDWLGVVEQTSSEALIDVYLSPAKANVGVPQRQEDFEQVGERARVGVGQLPFLTVGSLWRDRHRLPRGVGVGKVFPDVQIASSAVQLIEAGAQFEVGPDEPRWVIPPYKHRLDWRVRQSHCFAIEYGGDPYGILLPVVEAIRFYYAVSTDLAHIAFAGGFQLDLDSIVDTSEFFGIVPGTERMVLKRRKWLSDDDGWIIGRVLEEPLAAAGIARVYDSLLRDSANSRLAFPECGLPFEGATRWRVRGIPLRIKDGERWLIYELLSCSALLPFRELHILSDNDGRQAEDAEHDLPDNEKRPAWSGPRRVGKVDPDTEMQSAEPPEFDIGQVVIPLASERFEDIAGKEIIKTPKEHCRYKSAELRRPQGLAALGTGLASGSPSAIAPLSAQWRQQEPNQRRQGLPTSFEALQAVVGALNASGGVSAHVRPSTPRLEYLPLTKPRSRRQWGYLDSEHKIKRQVMIVDIDCSGTCGSLIEFERRKDERSRAALLISSDTVSLSDERLWYLLHALVKAEGVWANLKPRPIDVELVLFNHSRTSAEAFAADICKALR
ncbi:MAG: hypothetical protein LBL59_02765 [Xanthomonadaceae bacterium]|jgi:hypothetical protein|nr:hypothetical protein [Xanthomonadaceae bacterium]